MIKDFAEKAQSANDNEASDSEKIWVVRGSPKNGLFLKKGTKFNFQKARSTMQTQKN